MNKVNIVSLTTYILLGSLLIIGAIAVGSYGWRLQATSIGVNGNVSLHSTTSTAGFGATIDPLPEVDFAALKQQVLNILGSRVDRYGIYVYDLQRRDGFTINGGMVLPPASVSKVPVAMLILKDIQDGKLNYDDTYPIKNSNKPYTHDRMAQYPEGKLVTLNRYLYYSIVYSDNTANATLEDIIGGSAAVNARIVSELGVDKFFRLPHEARANAVGKVLRNFYDGIYLQGEYRERLMYLLLNTASHLQDGIPAQLPEGTDVAHKTGQLPFYVWEDAGIVYGPNTEFVIVFLNKNVTYSGARKKVQNISRVVYEALN